MSNKSLKCAICEHIVTLVAVPKKYICPACGVLNTPMPETAGSSKDALDCIHPKGFEWKLPAGVITGADVDLYISPDDGSHLTRLEWINIFGYDPRIKLAQMRERGEEGVPGFFNTSSLGGRKT